MTRRERLIIATRGMRVRRRRWSIAKRHPSRQAVCQPYARVRALHMPTMGRERTVPPVSGCFSRRRPPAPAAPPHACRSGAAVRRRLHHDIAVARAPALSDKVAIVRRRHRHRPGDRQDVRGRGSAGRDRRPLPGFARQGRRRPRRAGHRRRCLARDRCREASPNGTRPWRSTSVARSCASSIACR